MTHFIHDFLQTVAQNGKRALGLCFPLLIAILVNPTLIITTTGITFLALFTTLGLLYQEWKKGADMKLKLTFIPTQEHLEKINKLIESFGIDSSKIAVRYAFFFTSPAAMAFDLLMIDPLLMTDFEHDPESVKCSDILKTHVVPTLSAATQKRYELMRAYLTPAAQKFILAHELGHYAYSFSYKRLLVLAITTFMSLFASLSLATIFLAEPVIALIFCFSSLVFFQMLSDYITNIVFNRSGEIQADLFAARYCSAEEIEAAAHFFSKLQDIYDAHPEPHTLMAHLPLELFSGHPDGKRRAVYLRKLIK